MVQNSIVLGVFFALFSCTTTRSGEGPMGKGMVEWPAGVQSVFGNCLGDGSGHMELSEEDAPKGSSVYDWTAGSGENFKIQWNSLLGSSLISAHVQKRAIQLTGSYAHHLPPLTVDEAGFLRVDQRRLGLKASELICLLSFQLPSAWKQNTMLFYDEQKNLQVSHEEANREILMSFQFNPAKSKTSSLTVCSEICWGGFLGIWKSSLTWCSHLGRIKKGDLTYQKLRLEWMADG